MTIKFAIVPGYLRSANHLLKLYMLDYEFTHLTMLEIFFIISDFLSSMILDRNSPKIHQNLEKIARKLKFGSNVCNNVRNHLKRFPSIVTGKCLNFIMVYFTQNIPSRIRKNEKRKLKHNVQVL